MTVDLANYSSGGTLEGGLLRLPSFMVNFGAIGLPAAGTSVPPVAILGSCPGVPPGAAEPVCWRSKGKARARLLFLRSDNRRRYCREGSADEQQTKRPKFATESIARQCFCGRHPNGA